MGESYVVLQYICRGLEVLVLLTSVILNLAMLKENLSVSTSVVQ